MNNGKIKACPDLKKSKSVFCMQMSVFACVGESWVYANMAVGGPLRDILYLFFIP